MDKPRSAARRAPRAVRERQTRAYAERVIADRGEVPTVAEVLREVGGDVHLVCRVLREYRAGTWADMRRPRDLDTNESP